MKCIYARFRATQLPSPQVPLGARSVGHHVVPAHWQDNVFQVNHVVFLFIGAGEDFVLIFAITMNLSVVVVALTSAAAPDVAQRSRKVTLTITGVDPNSLPG